MNGKIPTADFIGVHHQEAVTRTEPDLKPSHSDMRCGDPRKHFSHYTTHPSLVSYLDSVIVSFVNCYHCEKPNKSYTGFLYILLSFPLPPFTFILMIRIESISLLERRRKIHTHARGRERKWEREKYLPSVGLLPKCQVGTRLLPGTWNSMQSAHMGGRDSILIKRKGMN